MLKWILIRPCTHVRTRTSQVVVSPQTSHLWLCKLATGSEVNQHNTTQSEFANCTYQLRIFVSLKMKLQLCSSPNCVQYNSKFLVIDFNNWFYDCCLNSYAVSIWIPPKIVRLFLMLNGRMDFLNFFSCTCSSFKLLKNVY